MSLVIPLNVSAEERGWTATARGWERPGQLITVAWKNGQVDHAALWDVAPARRPRLVLVESLYRSNRHKKLVILRWLVADRPDQMDVADPPPWGHDYAPTLTPSVNAV